MAIRGSSDQLPVIAISLFGDGTERAMKQAAHALRDDLLKLPGISKVQLNGIRDDVQYFRPLYNLDRVEIHKGANALIFGRG